MINNAISDMIIRIKNAYLANLKETAIPYSKLTKSLGEILVKEGFLKALKETGDGNKRKLTVFLKYDGKRSALTDVKIISKPSLRVYVSKNKIPRVLGGLGISIISTPQGLKTGFNAKKENLGGEFLLKIW